MEQNQQENVVFNIEKIYIKDVSYEAPSVPMVFAHQETRQVDVQLIVEHALLNPEQGLYEVALTVTATAKRENKSLFLIEVKQAGIFRILGITGEMLQKTLEVICPHALLPFAREAINEFVCKGGFSQLLITPINFEALYEQKQADMKEQSQKQ